MKASIVDLRYHMNDVLKALDRQEEVTVVCRGKVKGIIYPASETSTKQVCDHQFFGYRKTEQNVEDKMNDIRGSRYRDI